MVKSSITKTPFKKWLKAAIKGNTVYYQEGRFIGTDLILINLSVIDNLDDLKPAIVEVFGHLEGCWMHRVNGEIIEMEEYEIKDAIEVGDLFDPIGSDEMSQITDSDFRTKRGGYIYDDLTVIPASLELLDYHHTFRDGNVVYFTLLQEGDKEVIMMIDGVTSLTGNDLDLDFISMLRKAYDDSNADPEPEEGDGDDTEAETE